MTIPEKLEGVANFLIKLNNENPDFTIVPFYLIHEITGITKPEAQEVCELLQKKGYIRYEYFPYFDTEPIFIPRDANMMSDYMDEKGAMRFFSSDGDIDFPTTEIGSVNFDKLMKVSESFSLRKSLAKQLRPQIQFDPEESKLTTNGKSLQLQSNNSRVIATKIFAVPYGTRIPENEIALHLDDTKESGKVVTGADAGYTYIYNCINRLNQKIEELSGVEHFIQYKQGKIWVE
jgi:hypothetical protein